MIEIKMGNRFFGYINARDIERYLDENNLNDVISANRTERGVVLVLQDSILFDSGEAVIRDSGKPFLHKTLITIKNNWMSEREVEYSISL